MRILMVFKQKFGQNSLKDQFGLFKKRFEFQILQLSKILQKFEISLSIHQSPYIKDQSIKQRAFDYKQIYIFSMEKITELFRPIHRVKTSDSFKISSKYLNINFHKTPQTFFYVPPLLINNNQDCVNFQQIMQTVKFSYRSFLQFNQIFKDEIKSQNEQTQRETNETEKKNQKYERKGFQFSQYSANNPSQDSICFFEINELNAFFISIFDGHGGRQLSEFCARNAQQYLLKYIRNGLKLQKYVNKEIQLIKDALAQLHFQFQNEFYSEYLKLTQSNKKHRGVGTCAITMVLYNKKCIIANCGDSQGMVISQNSGSYNYEKLCERFSASNKVQRLRIIEKFKQVDGNIFIEERKNVFYLKGVLQPTKSIGDYYLKHKHHYVGQDEFKGPYLSCQPDIRIYDIKEHDKYIVLASDGLWDYLSKWQILKYVVESKNEKSCICERETESQTEDEKQSQYVAAPKYLVQKIMQKVSNELQIDIKYLQSLELGERRSYHDDITIGIIDLQQFFESRIPFK